MKPRYNPRAVVEGSVAFIVGGFTGEGHVLDLTVPGCLIESPLSPIKGDSLTLRVSLPQVGAMFRVARGVVRWVQGSRFGVEFIEMEHKERLRYNATVDKLLQQQLADHSRPDQKSYSHELGGVNWHLEEYGASATTHTVASAEVGRRTR